MNLLSDGRWERTVPKYMLIRQERSRQGRALGLLTLNRKYREGLAWGDVWSSPDGPVYVEIPGDAIMFAACGHVCLILGTRCCQCDPPTQVDDGCEVCAYRMKHQINSATPASPTAS